VAHTYCGSQVGADKRGMPNPFHFIGSSLRNQLLAGFAVVIVFLAAGAVVSVSSIGSIAAGTHRDVDEAVQAGVVTSDTYNMQGSEMMIVLTGASPAELANHAGDVKQFVDDLEALEDLTLIKSDAAQVSRVQAAFRAWQAVDHRVAVLAAHDVVAASALARNGANHATDTLATDIAGFATQLAHRADSNAESRRAQATLITIVLAVLAILAAIAIALVISRRTTSGMLSMLRAADGISAGDLDQEIEVRSRDEIGRMARAFERMVAYLRRMAAIAESVAEGNLTVAVEPQSDRDVLGRACATMTANMKALIGEMSDAAGVLSSTSRQMATSSEETGRAVGEIATAATDVASGAERQVRMVEDAKRSAGEVTEAAAISAESAEETARVAVEAQDAARQGVDAAAQANEAMGAVRDSSETVTAAIRELAAKSERIGAIVATIGGIAEQTNMLALNAAIEAARAGEQGRGFAVVAEQVRTLAEESKAATHEISDLIASVQAETGRAVTVVERGAKLTRDGAEVVDETRRAFVQIQDSIDGITARIAQIAASGQQIAASAENMQRSIDEVAAVAEASSASTEEVSASTQQTSASAQEIAAAAQELSSNADGLHELVGRFRTT
jgi:methyl-accepting chemotaxis protein